MFILDFLLLLPLNLKMSTNGYEKCLEINFYCFNYLCINY